MGIGRKSEDLGIAFLKRPVLAPEFKQEGLKLAKRPAFNGPCQFGRQGVSQRGISTIKPMLLEFASSLTAFKRVILGRTDPLGRTCLRQIKGDAGLGLEEKACCVLRASKCGADGGRATPGPGAPV